jgi:hypothetical protein
MRIFLLVLVITIVGFANAFSSISNGNKPNEELMFTGMGFF